VSTNDKKISKFLSLVLRHKPEAAGLTLDENGWGSIDALLQGAKKAGIDLDHAKLEEIVRNSDKQRFAMEGHRIRANQGHSVSVDLDLTPVAPPAKLFHGTVAKFLGKIEKDGLRKMNRQYVHLSSDLETAVKVGARRGKPIILEVDSQRMHEEGHTFYCSNNGVWLTDSVPYSYIKPTSNQV